MKRRATTLLELMVVMALWAGLLVTILGFYISSTKIVKRHDSISASYRKVHELLESIETLLNRSRVYSINEPKKPLKVIYAQPVEGLSVTPCGYRVFQRTESLTLDRNPADPLPLSSEFPLLGDVVLNRPGQKRLILYPLELGWRVNLRKLEDPPQGPQTPGKEYMVALDIDIPTPKASAPITSVDDIVSADIRRFERLILLDNAKLGGSL